MKWDGGWGIGCRVTTNSVISVFKTETRGFLGGSMVKKKKNLPTNAGNMGLIPDPERSYMPWSN